MKIFKKILLSILCISFLSSIVFIGYRMILSKAKFVTTGNINKNELYTRHINTNGNCLEYNDKKYYEVGYYDLPKNYDYEEIKNDRLTYCRESNLLSFITYSIFGFKNDNSINMLFRNNHGIFGSSEGWIYIREDYVFPTIKNSEVYYIELGFPPEKSIFLYDEKTINKVVDYIKNRKDISEIFSIEKYGAYKLYVHYKDAPVYEKIGGVWGGKYMYQDEYWTWTETDEFWKWVESTTE